MNFNQLALELARERQERLIEEHLHARRVPEHRASIRRSIGLRLIAAGQRIAAEPSLELARFR
jgi:hypothetical protein